MYFCGVWPHPIQWNIACIIGENRQVGMEARSRLRDVASVYSTSLLGMILISPDHIHVLFLQLGEVIYLLLGEGFIIYQHPLDCHVFAGSVTSAEGT